VYCKEFKPWSLMLIVDLFLPMKFISLEIAVITIFCLFIQIEVIKTSI
jgi:hypothetical protein